MSESLDILALLNAPTPNPLPGAPPKVPTALGADAAKGHERLTLTPEQEKEKAAKGQLFLRAETATYKIGPPERPKYFHDNGHLGNGGAPLNPVHTPTEADRKMFETFVTRLQVAELMCNDRDNKKEWPWENRQRFVRECGGNQPDANLAFRNFLFGNGRSRRIDYERCLKDEDSIIGIPSGTNTWLRALIHDFMAHAEAIGLNRKRFSITSKQMYGIGDRAFAKGPQSWNWRRTLGAHVIWISADLTAEAAPLGTHIIYKGDLTFQIEDMFNFNPGSSDGGLNILDAEGGMLELSGLGKQFMTFATIYRHVEWNEKKPESVKILTPPPSARFPEFKEDHAKEEALLRQAQSDLGASFYATSWGEMAEKAYRRFFR